MCSLNGLASKLCILEYPEYSLCTMPVVGNRAPWQMVGFIDSVYEDFLYYYDNFEYLVEINQSRCLSRHSL